MSDVSPAERPDGVFGSKKRKRFAQPAEALWAQPDRIWDVVIVGSGYGGSTAAAAFAGLKNRAGNLLQVCVLERGQEYLPEDFPQRFSDLPKHVGMAIGQASPGGGEALLDFRVGNDVCALVANGVGGGSLINAGVLVEPDPVEVSKRSPFGGALVVELKRDGWYDRAKNTLGGQVRENGHVIANSLERHVRAAEVRKGKALDSLSPKAGRHSLFAEAVSVSVSMAPEANAAGLRLNACTLCGDCMTGCHQGAKNSLDNNLLVLASEAGAHIFTGVSVMSLEAGKAQGQEAIWELHSVHTSLSLQRQQGGPVRVMARHVVLAAGTLGSSEILLRSRSDKLPLSPALGANFSCNGDNLAAFYGLKEEVNGCADEEHPPAQRFVGPTITREIQVPANAYQHDPAIGDHLAFRVQEFAVPGPVRRLFEEIVTTSHALHTVGSTDGSMHGSERIGERDPLAVQPALIGKTLLVGVIGHDSGKGVLRLDIEPGADASRQRLGRVQIHWPDARYGKELEVSDRILQAWAAAQGATLLANPLWKLLPGELSALVSQSRGPVVTVHPLGGCAAGGSSTAGVVNAFGEVWDPRSTGVHPGLAVLDGAVFGHSLGANPALSIAAFSLRAAEHLAQSWWGVAPMSVGQAPVEVAVQAPFKGRPHAALAASSSDTEVQIIERMRGKATLLIGGKPLLCMVEMTLAFEPIGLRAMGAGWGRRLPLSADTALVLGVDERRVEVQVLRAYDHGVWEALGLSDWSDEARQPLAKLTVPLSGHMRLLEREPSSPGQRRWRAAKAWALNRGIHEFLEVAGQFFFRYLPPEVASKLSHTPLCERAKGLWHLSSRAGERRLLEYHLTVANPAPSRAEMRLPEGFQVGSVVCGVKTLTYNRRANPWTQLLQMKLLAMPNLLVVKGDAPVLTLDARFLAKQGVPLMRITRQANQAQALLDLLSLGFYIARLLIHIHLWTFRQSDRQKMRAVQRLPGPLHVKSTRQWVSPEITELTVDHIPKTVAGQFAQGDPVKIRLTRYANRESALPALVMIHGYSVSGNTFTHASIPVSAAEYFWRRGRDVWILDLRSSTGLTTCTYPWSMEQVALVDIPAALLHVRQLTGRGVDVLAHCIGCAMFSMAMLTAAKEVRNNSVTLGVGDWLNDSHLGTLDAFHGPEGLAVHPTVNRVVLSQKGPVLRYSDANVFRAFVMQIMRRWFLNDVFSFQVPEEGGLIAELLDRLLASLPYPSADYDAQNPIWSFRRTPWTQSRRRMDMLFGRDFNAENLRPETLNAIDDLFGPLHLDTVAQTIHFARFNLITNQRGVGEFVTAGRLRTRWNVAGTFAFYGRDNGLVDASTNGLLSECFMAAGVPLTTEVFANKGHQDVFIGLNNARIYGSIDRFFSAPAIAPALVNPLLPDVYMGMPWIGPRLKMPKQARGDLVIAARSRPDQGRARLLLVPVIVPVNGRAAQIGPSGAYVQARAAGLSQRWHFLALTPGLINSMLQAQAQASGWLVLFLYDAPEVASVDRAFDFHGAADMSAVDTEKPLEASDAFLARQVNAKAEPADCAADQPISAGTPGRLGRVSWSSVNKRFCHLGSASLADGEVAELAAIERWIVSEAWSDLRQAFVSLEDVQNAMALKDKNPSKQLCFALGSCQYPAGMLDAKPAGASLETLAGHLDKRASTGCDLPAVSFAIFAGDQIYADASAGLADAVRRDERFHVPHERALRQPGLRAVLRRIPAAMLLDDHEISDNWTRLSTTEPEHAANEKQRARGLEAFLLYQRMDNGAWRSHAKSSTDAHFEWGGLPVYLLDTRSQRAARSAGTAPQIIARQQREALKDWLLANRLRPKCIVTPSLFLPRRQAHLSGQRSDAFDGYPASQGWLIDLLVSKEIKHTLFLSGDEHHSMVCVADMYRAGLSLVKLVSIHSSALYAPYPFANGLPSDLVTSERFITPAEGTQVDVLQVHHSSGDGFARIAIDQSDPENPTATVWFHKPSDCQKFGPFEF